MEKQRLTPEQKEEVISQSDDVEQNLTVAFNLGKSGMSYEAFEQWLSEYKYLQPASEGEKKTAEEILDKYAMDYHFDQKQFSYRNVLKIMEEYAQQFQSQEIVDKLVKVLEEWIKWTKADWPESLTQLSHKSEQLLSSIKGV